MSNRQIEVEATDAIEHLHYEPVSPKYRSVQMVGAVIGYALLGAAALLLLLTDVSWLCVAAEAVIALSLIINLAILRRAYQCKGYALREHDITYRSGVIFPKVTTVPYVRIQQVSISQNPVSRFFGLCALEVVNGAQGLSSLVIQGLTGERAEEVKAVITGRLNGKDD